MSPRYGGFTPHIQGKPPKLPKVSSNLYRLAIVQFAELFWNIGWLFWLAHPLILPNRQRAQWRAPRLSGPPAACASLGATRRCSVPRQSRAEPRPILVGYWQQGHLLVGSWQQGHFLVGNCQHGCLLVGSWQHGHLVVGKWQQGHLLVAMWWQGHLLVGKWPQGHLLVGFG